MEGSRKAFRAADGWKHSHPSTPTGAIWELLNPATPQAACGHSNSITLGRGPSSILFQGFPCDSDLQPGVRATPLGHLVPEIRLTSSPAVRLMPKELPARFPNPPNSMCVRKLAHQQLQKVSPMFSYCPIEPSC